MRYASTTLTRLADPTTWAAAVGLIGAHLADQADRVEHSLTTACGTGTDEARELRRAYATLATALERHTARLRALPDHWDRLDAADGDPLSDAADTWERAVEACEQAIRDTLAGLR
jgi:hypothetical protein